MVLKGNSCLQCLVYLAFFGKETQVKSNALKGVTFFFFLKAKQFQHTRDNFED